MDIGKFLTIEFGIKAFLVLFLVFYLVYALLIVRQVQLMGRAISSRLSPILKFLSIVNVGFALALLLLAVGIL